MTKYIPWLIGGLVVYLLVKRNTTTTPSPNTTEGKNYTPERNVDPGPTLRGFRRNVSV